MKITYGYITCNLSRYNRISLNAILDIKDENDEVVVLQNGCRNSWIREEKNVKVVTWKERKGIPQARNEILRNVEGDIVIWVDDDTVILQSLDRIKEAFETDEKIGIVGYDGCAVNDAFTQTGSIPAHWKVGIDSPQIDYFDGLYAVRMKMILDVGDYNENLSPVDADNSELCIRAQVKGWKLKPVAPPTILHWRSSSRMVIFAKDHVDLDRSRWIMVEEFGENWREKYGIPTPPTADRYPRLNKLPPAGQLDSRFIGDANVSNLLAKAAKWVRIEDF